MNKLDSKQVQDKVAALKNNPKALGVFLAVIFLLDIFILVRVQFIPLAHMWSRAAKVSADIRQARLDSDSASSLKSRLGDLKAEWTSLTKKTLAEEELPKALESISKSADISTVKILKIRPMPEARRAQKPTKVGMGDELMREKISVTANAGFHQLGRFIALLENSPVFFDIRKLEIRGDSQEYTKHSITIFLDVVLRKS